MKTYPLEDGMRLVVADESGNRWTVTFHAKAFHDVGAATAEEVAAVLTAAGVHALVDESGGVVLQRSPLGGALTVVSGESTAAEALGMSGGGGGSPVPAEGDEAPGAARGKPKTAPRLVVHNQTGSPIQLVMVTRTIVIPAGKSMPLTPAEAAHRPLRRLVESGAVRLAFDPKGTI